MTLKKSILPLAVAALLAACSTETEFNPTKTDDSGSESKVSRFDDVFGNDDDSVSSSSESSPSETDDVIVVDTYENLVVCSAKREGVIAFVKDEKATYLCDGKNWRGENSIPEVIYPDTTAPYVMDSILAEFFNSSSSFVMPGMSSSSVIMPSISSSSVIMPGMSSSSVEYSSSSAMVIILPSGECGGKLMCWSGAAGEYFVDTGLDNGTETSGFWYTFADDADGGASKIVWPVELGNDYNEDALDPVIDECGGLCGSYVLNAGTLDYKPFVGVAFNVAGSENALINDPYPADASAWGGLCITYTVDVAAVLELGLGNAGDAAISYDNPFVTLQKSSAGNQVCKLWSEFKQGGWGRGKITGDEASAALASVKFKIQAADGTTGSFNIISISSYY